MIPKTPKPHRIDIESHQFNLIELWFWCSPGVHVLLKAVDDRLSLHEVFLTLPLLTLLDQHGCLGEGLRSNLNGLLRVLHDLKLEDREVERQAQSHAVVGLETSLADVAALLISLQSSLPEVFSPLAGVHGFEALGGDGHDRIGSGTGGLGGVSEVVSHYLVEESALFDELLLQSELLLLDVSLKSWQKGVSNELNYGHALLMESEL